MSQITGGIHRGHAAGDTNIEKAASQLVADTKYKVKQKLGDNINKMAPGALIRAYMEQLSKSPAGPVRALAQKKLTGGSMKENFNIDALASSSVANALFKVFIEGVEEECVLGEEYLVELMKKNSEGENLYWIKVYYKNGTTYKRWADRARMSELRSNPNISNIEISEEPPKEDEGNSNDGNLANNYRPYNKVTRGDVVAGARGEDQMGGKRKVKEDVDLIQEKRNSKNKDKKYDIMRGKKNTGRVKLFPEVGKSYNEQVSLENGYSKFLDMVTKNKFASVEEGAKVDRMVSHIKTSEIKSGKSPEESENIAWATANKRGMLDNKNKKKVTEESACDSSEPQEDMRGDYAKREVLKNKLRSALGVKNPMIMTAEGTGLSVGVSKIAGQIMSNPSTSAEQGAKNFQKNVTDPIGKAVKGAVRAVVQPANMSDAAQKARNNKYSK